MAPEVEFFATTFTLKVELYTFWDILVVPPVAPPVEAKLRENDEAVDLFNSFKKKKRASINPVGFFVGKNNIYLTTDNGRLLVVDLKIGKTKSIIKIDRNKISRPFILNQNMFLIKEDSIIKLD
mgnify:CR=1 FL=1